MGLSEKSRRARYYRLSEKGRRELRVGAKLWSGFALAVGRVLSATEQPVS